MKQFTKKTATVVFLAMLTMQAYSQATKTGQNKSLSNKELFDSGWQFTRDGKTTTVDLPHDWDIFDAPNPETGATGTGGGWFQGGKGEYRKSFKTPAGEVSISVPRCS